LPSAKEAGGRRVVLTRDPDGHAIGTARGGFAVLSVPVFCRGLVERIAAGAPYDSDVSGIRIDTDYLLA
jgi:hypothetical protein